MLGFDIENLLEFHPARSWCLKCLALWRGFDEEDYEYGAINKLDGFIYEQPPTNRCIGKCEICGVKYIPKLFKQINNFVQSEIGLPLQNIDDIMNHLRQMAIISSAFRKRDPHYPPFRALMDALSHARSFVHFTSYGITQMLIGILKMVAQSIPVCGIVSGNVGEHIISEVTDFKFEAPNLEIIFCESRDFRTLDIPHQKLVIIDGILAFKGSANLTQTAWRSAGKGTDIIELCSNTEEVISLHNRFFSPIWGKMSKAGDEIEML